MRAASVASLLVLVLLIPPAVGANCAGTSVGLTPLSELGGSSWLGQSGGFYPHGGSERPLRHEALGLAAASLILPRDASGLPDPLGGRAVFLSIGMSNTRNEFTAFVPLANADPARDPRVIAVNGAIGGQTAAAISNPNAPYWTNVDQLLANAGVSAQQVQVVWLKEANAGPRGDPVAYARTLASQLDTIVGILGDRFPNLAIVYASSRIYAGYASTALNPEPYAYASGFSVKWLVEQRMSAASLPWVSWGPYLWADGLVPRTDGLTWSCGEFSSDGTHPSASGSRKVADMLLDFVHEDPTARAWYAS